MGPPNNKLVGDPPTPDDKRRLGKSWLTPELVEQALIRRVDDGEARKIVGVSGRASENFAGLLFPYIWPGEDRVRDYRLRRDAPPLERKADGTTKQKNKHLSPPDRGNMLYFVPDPGVASSCHARHGPLTLSTGRHLGRLELARDRGQCDRPKRACPSGRKRDGELRASARASRASAGVSSTRAWRSSSGCARRRITKRPKSDLPACTRFVRR